MIAKILRTEYRNILDWSIATLEVSVRFGRARLALARAVYRFRPFSSLLPALYPFGTRFSHNPELPDR